MVWRKKRVFFRYQNIADFFRSCVADPPLFLRENAPVFNYWVACVATENVYICTDCYQNGNKLVIYNLIVITKNVAVEKRGENNPRLVEYSGHDVCIWSWDKRQL